MRKSFAYVHNQRMPNEFAFGIYVAKTCEAVNKLGYKSYLLYPRRVQSAYFRSNDLFDYYHVKQSVITAICISVNEFLNLPRILEIIVKHLRHQLITWAFAIQSIYFLQKHKIAIIQTTDREIIFLLRLVFWHRPTVIYDVHVEPRVFYEKILDKLILPRIDVFLVNSQFYIDYYCKQGIHGDKFILLPCGYDPILFKPQKNVKQLRKKLKLPLNKFIIGFIGRFATFGDEKGIEEMISAVAHLKTKMPIAVVAVGGPDELVDKYKQLAKQLGLNESEAIIRPQVKPSEVPEYIASFDVACMLYPDTHHYRDKMSPQKAIEYMAMDKPIIATSLPSIKQILKDFAYFIEPGDQKALEDTIIKITSDYSKAQNKATLAYRYVQDFSWENRHKQLFSLTGVKGNKSPSN